jgi:hypothetical protein
VRDAVTRNPVGGAEVESIGGVNRGRGIRTDSNGSYRLDGLLAGSMIMRASADGYLSQTGFALVSRDVTLDFDLAKSYRYFGIVRDGVGNPVPGTLIRSAFNCDLSTVTDSRGLYDATCSCPSVIFEVRPPTGYEGVLPQFQLASPAGDHNFTTKRITSVSLAAPSQIPKSDGTLFFSVSVSVGFDDGTSRRLGSQDFVTLQSSNVNVVRTRGADGNKLTIEGVSVGTASITTTYWGVVSPAVSVTVF